ncbi:MAG: maleylpyruvate isomerase family mycothiol-dependent enzyme [Acidimicrobiales bacterium]
MTLPRETVIPGMLAEYGVFAELVHSLSDAEWETASRCAGWRTADVAAHVIGQLTDVVNLRLDGLGSPEATSRQVEEHRGRSQSELAEELEAGIKVASDMVKAFDSDEGWAAPIGGQGLSGTVGFGLESLWFDTYLHADDIRAVIGRTSPRGEGVRASLSHISQVLSDQGWGPATLQLDGYEAFPVSGGGAAVTGDAFDFVLASTGRIDPSGLGLDETVNIYR